MIKPTQLFVFILFLWLAVSGCKNQGASPKQHSFTILQLNDVYEIGALSGGREGGMARVATVRKQLLAEDPNTFTVLAGDFVSPSLLGTLKVYDSLSSDSMVAGKQMIEVMNATGVDYVTFGNHEFDIPMYRLRARINESSFDWVSSNVFRKTPEGNAPFVKIRNGKTDTIQPFIIKTISYPDGGKIRLGLIGLTLNFNKADSVFYDDIYASARNTYDKIKDQCDLVIAITHLEIGMDSILATKVPELNLIIGGHEHVNNLVKVGNVNICKADDNAKSVYIHKISWDSATHKATITSTLKKIDTSVAFDNDVDKIVNKWLSKGNASIRKNGYNPAEELMVATRPLDGRDEKTRSSSTNYTRLIADAMIYAAPDVDLAVYNSGSLRLDDEIEGTITVNDVLRSLPFGGALVLGELDGATIKKMVEGGQKNENKGGYLQYANLANNGGNWEINGKSIEDTKKYKVVMAEFLALGKEANLDFLSKFKYTKPAVLKGGIRNDIRDATIAYMKSGMTQPKWEN